MQKSKVLFAVLLTVAMLGVACGTGAETTSVAAAPPAVANEQDVVDRDAFRDAVRALWEDHITWTRLYIVSAVDGLKDVDVTAQRLLRNQTEIGDAIKPFFGDAAGNELTTLLNEHILGAADLITAAQSGNDAAVTKASKAWYRNGDQIADFLSKAGLGDRADVRAMMKGHLDTTLDEAVARLQGDYEAEIAAYDEVRKHIHIMADAIADGLIAKGVSSDSTEGGYDH
jgi:hypothetical protein